MSHHRLLRHLILIPSLALVTSLLATTPGGPGLAPYHFTTLTTPASNRSDDGIGPEARFSAPTALAIDTHGNLIVADRDNNTLRLVTPDGRVTTLAGTAGRASLSYGPFANSAFNHPSGVAIDRVGNIVVADSGNGAICALWPRGTVELVAGSAGDPPVDGDFSHARFINPTAIAADRAGNIYVADSRQIFVGSVGQTQFFTTIRKISPDHTVSTIAGKYGVRYSVSSPPPPLVTPTDLMLAYVDSLAVDPSGNLYLADRGTIIKIAPGGLMTNLTGNNTSYTRVGTISGLAVADNGDLFFGDTTNYVVCKLTTAGVLTTVAGQSGSSGSTDGVGSAARFGRPTGFVLDAAGNLFLADETNNTIRKITPDGTVTTIAGRPPFNPGGPDSPPLDQFLQQGTGLTADAQGNLYASTASTILRLGADGTITTLAGAAGQTGYTDATGADARFVGIRNFTTTAGGDVYVVDQDAIRKVTSQGVVTTLAGDPTQAGGNDGTGTAARFNYPWDLALDAGGNVYVTDRWNYVIRKVTPAGVVTTLAGLANVAASSDGTGASARFTEHLTNITCDPITGNLFLIDDGKLRKVTPDGTVSTFTSYYNFTYPAFNGNMTADGAGNILVASIGDGPSTSKLWRFPGNASPGIISGTILGGSSSTTAGVAVTGISVSGIGDGTGPNVRFGPITAVAVAMDGHILVRQESTLLSTGLPNQAPVVGTPGSLTTPSNQSVTFLMPATDPDGDPLAYDITQAIGTRTIAFGNLVTFTPAGGNAGSVTFKASDFYSESATATVNITFTPAVTYLANISTRGRVGAGDNVLIAGFVVTGPAKIPKTVLIRAAGPALSSQNVSGVLNHPVITLVQGSTAIGSNQGWGTAGNAPFISQTATSVSAFTFPDGSNDSALLVQLLPGVYSAVVSGAGGDEGVALAEVYDAEPANPAYHPVNVSSRGFVGTGDNVLIAGFIVNGTTPQKFLIRAVGPGLAGFNVASHLADPQIHLYQGPTVINHVTGWTNDTDMQAAVTQTGAFPLTAGSADAAAIVTLAPGNYTVMVSSQSGASGIALVEVYQVP